jgi:hypothetical protein
MEYDSFWLTKNASIKSVFRYMDHVHIDKFFEDGTLLLGTTHSNRVVEDLQRRDPNEGIHYVRVFDPNNFVTKPYLIKQRDHHSILMLCTSLSEGEEEKWEVNSCMEIFDIAGFMKEIHAVLYGVEYMRNGLVNYSGSPVINYTPKPNQIKFPINDNDFGRFTLDLMAKDGVKIANLVPELNFLKEERFSSDMEYRMVWKVQMFTLRMFKFPGARKYCRNITR